VETLVVGYGNDLRSDDGAGRVVADRIEALGLPGVTVRSVSQLTPELALEMAGADRVIFVDASVEVARTTLGTVGLETADDSPWTHFTTPAALLAMTGEVGPVPAHAHTVSIPVADLGLGIDLSPIAGAGVEEAVTLINQLICE
jgi:hydrogenase maturation protease